MILIAIAKIVASVLALIIVALFFAYLIKGQIKPEAINLFDDGYILTKRLTSAVAFKDTNSAQHFAQRAAESGIYWDVYAVFNGKIMRCGNTKDIIIS